MISGGLCFLFDIALFTIFNYFLGNNPNHIIYATIFARIISSFINYLLNRYKVFKTNDNKKADKFTLVKYFLLVIICMLVSAHSVNYLYKILNINESVVKIIIDGLLCIINFFIQKKTFYNVTLVMYCITYFRQIKTLEKSREFYSCTCPNSLDFFSMNQHLYYKLLCNSFNLYFKGLSLRTLTILSSLNI